MINNIDKKLEFFQNIRYGFNFSYCIRLFIFSFFYMVPRRLIYKYEFYVRFLNFLIKGIHIIKLNKVFILTKIDDFRHIDERFESNIQHWFNTNSNLIFFDVGANIGRYSFTLAEKFKRVYCFEPVPETYQSLKRGIALNQLDNIIPYNYALWSKDTLKTIYVKKHSGINSLVIKNDFISKIKIQARKLDTLIGTEIFTPRIDLIKIDIEGAEFQALKGMKNTLKNYKPNLIIEIKKENISRVFNLLFSMGYRLKERNEENYFFIFSINNLKK